MIKLILCATAVSCVPTATVQAGWFFQNRTAEVAAWAAIVTSIAFCCKDKHDNKSEEHKNENFSVDAATETIKSSWYGIISAFNKYFIGREDGTSPVACAHNWWKKLQGPAALIAILAALGRTNWASACRAGKIEGFAHFLSTSN